MILKINEQPKNIQIIDVRITKQINLEHTLFMKIVVKNMSNSLLENYGNDINIFDEIEIDKQKYIVYETNIEGLGKNIKSIYANHISYKLNKKISIKGEFSLNQVVNTVLENSPFTLNKINVKNPITRYIDYSDITNRQVLINIANDYKVELDFDNYKLNIYDKIGKDKRLVFKYGKNIKSLTKITNEAGTSYEIDIVELRDILGEEEIFDIGDYITLQDETLDTNVKLRILKIEYNPFNRINTKIEIGNVRYTFADYYLDDLQEIREETDEKIEKLQEKIEKIKLPKLEEVTYNQIVEVFKKEVISANTIHSMTAWIEELEVNYLRTNFKDRINNKGKEYNYIYAHDMQIDFITAILSDSEMEQYETISGRKLYYTAIADNIDAYKYFTLTMPSIPQVEVNNQGEVVDDEWKKQHPNEKTTLKNATANFNGNIRQVKEEDFYVMVPKIIKSYVKMQIKFEQDEKGNSSPIIIFGAGDGQGEYSSKAKIYKDSDGFALDYFLSDTNKKSVYLNSKNSNLRNIAVFDKLPQDLSDLQEGDIVFEKEE